jgi:hypothetical protein
MVDKDGNAERVISLALVNPKARQSNGENETEELHLDLSGPDPIFVDRAYDIFSLPHPYAYAIPLPECMCCVLPFFLLVPFRWKFSFLRKTG